MNKANLGTIKKIPTYDPNVIIATVNIQSLKAKELQVSELFDDHGLDILVLTETWLSIRNQVRTGVKQPILIKAVPHYVYIIDLWAGVKDWDLSVSHTLRYQC